MRSMLVVCLGLAALGCGQRSRPIPDAGDEDAGVDGGSVELRPVGVMPPTGYSLAAAQSTQLAGSNRIGASVAMALDQNDQPVLAYVYEDPNGDGVTQDTRVEFTRWSGADGGFWEEPRLVEVVGPVDTSHPHRQVSIARDEATGELGIVYVTSAATANLALSNDEGATWSLETVSEAGGAVSDPVLALRGGVAHLAYHQAAARCSSGNCGAVIYRTRTEQGALTSAQQVPLLAGTESNPASPISLATDGSGDPALAYFLESSSTSTRTLAFWRPGTSTAAKVADSAGQADANASVSLVFRGELAHLAYHLAGDPVTQLYYSVAADEAATQFVVPIGIPRNGAVSSPETTQYYQAISLGSGSQVAIAANFELATQALQQCGGPKLAKSTDGAAFSVCSPDGGRFLGFAGKWVSLSRERSGKLTLAFLYEQRANPSIGAGIVLWRQP